VSSGDTVVEIGPGLGTLTTALLAAGADVWAVEKDATLAAYLRTTLLPQFPDRLHLMEADAVEHPLAGLPSAQAMDFKVVANLPYAISTPWLDALLSGPLPTRLVLMLQLEAAERYAAAPGTKTFGAISVFLQAAYEVAPGHRVSSGCFHPRPDVDSALLHLVRKPQPYVFPTPTRTFIRGCFQQRRKQIGALLRDRLPDQGQAWLAILAAAGCSAQTRPEAIPVALWQQLQVPQPPA
jgi:16S rRNA (adenine1518-N6/adenine1519-N6)-dimethyltransferase